MKHKYFKPTWVITLVTILMISSCQNKENGIKPPKQEGVSYTITSNIVTPEAATRQAEDLIGLLDSSLRGTSRKVKNITPIYKEGLRASDSTTPSETIAYLVNFSNNSGYALLSADSRLTPVWTLSETGNIDIEKPIENQTTQLLMKQIELSYNVEHCKLIDHIEGGDDHPIPFPPNPKTHYEYGAWEKIPSETFEALIPVVWGQSSAPYNLYIPHEKSFHAGCVTAAVAQIMAFHSYPLSYNWEEMRKHHPIDNPSYSNPNSYHQIGLLYKNLGEALNVDYSPDGSGAYDKDVPKAFKKFGYNNSGVLSDFCFEKVKSEICRSGNKGYPLYISASSKMEVRYKYFLFWEWEEVNYESGHAFIIDGVTKAKRLVRKINTDTGEEISRKYETMNLLHANLGWDSQYYNRYYNSTVFNPCQKPILEQMTRSSIGEKNVYRYNFKIITGIRP